VLDVPEAVTIACPAPVRDEVGDLPFLSQPVCDLGSLLIGEPIDLPLRRITVPSDEVDLLHPEDPIDQEIPGHRFRFLPPEDEDRLQPEPVPAEAEPGHVVPLHEDPRPAEALAQVAKLDERGREDPERYPLYIADLHPFSFPF